MQPEFMYLARNLACCWCWVLLQIWFSGFTYGPHISLRELRGHTWRSNSMEGTFMFWG